MSQIELLKAYYRLEGMKNNIPSEDSICDNYVNDYHSIIDLLEKITSINLANFRVPTEVMKKHLTENWRKGEMTKEQYCHRPVLMMKVDAVLMFFRFQMSTSNTTEKKQIGFSVD